MHYYRQRKHGDPLITVKLPNGTWTNIRCYGGEDGVICNNPIDSHGMCTTHLKQKRRNDPEAPRCQAEGCDRSEMIGGYCEKDAAYLKTYGDLSRPRTPPGGTQRLSTEYVRKFLIEEREWEPIFGWIYVNNRTNIPGTCLRCDSPGKGPRFSSLRNGGACAGCGASGWKLNDPALLYLVYSEDFQAYKIGFTKEKSHRLNDHRRNGWEEIRQWNGFIGHTAYAVERTVLRSWRDAGMPRVCSREDMPQGGYTETVPAYLVEPDMLYQQVEKLLNEYGVNNYMKSLKVTKLKVEELPGDDVTCPIPMSTLARSTVH
jgi:hypothetical protein